MDNLNDYIKISLDEDGNEKLVINLKDNNGETKEALSLTHRLLTFTESIETSDKRTKDCISPTDLEDSYKKIMKLNMVNYNFKDDEIKRLHTGVIAQELNEIIPEAVVIGNNRGLEDFHSVSSKQLIGHLLSCIQYMDIKINKLENN